MTKNDYWQRKICGIYLIQEKETGRAYVGQSNDCIKRWKAHTTPGKKSSGIAGAIKDAGVDKFIFCVLEEVSKDLLNDREKYWIAKYDCVEPMGWNRTSGGSSSKEVPVKKLKGHKNEV
jgi:group I intron endonuclease